MGYNTQRDGFLSRDSNTSIRLEWNHLHRTRSSTNAVRSCRTCSDAFSIRCSNAQSTKNTGRRSWCKKTIASRTDPTEGTIFPSEKIKAKRTGGISRTKLFAKPSPFEAKLASFEALRSASSVWRAPTIPPILGSSTIPKIVFSIVRRIRSGNHLPCGSHRNFRSKREAFPFEVPFSSRFGVGVVSESRMDPTLWILFPAKNNSEGKNEAPSETIAKTSRS